MENNEKIMIFLDLFFFHHSQFFFEKPYSTSKEHFWQQRFTSMFDSFLYLYWIFLNIYLLKFAVIRNNFFDFVDVSIFQKSASQLILASNTVSSGKWSDPAHFLKAQGKFFLSFLCALFLHIFDT